MSDTQKIGKVILAGAGPGDPELISLKAVKALRQADVVILDRLVSSEIIDEHVRPDALVIYAGKQAGKGYSTRQSTINQMLVEYALQGKNVVRLKGGDVSIFSNVLDELQALVDHSIPFEMIPGISAALGAAAYSGIPLTARDHSTAVRFLTYFKKELLSDEYWKELAATDDTLVFYMSGETLPKIIQKLSANNVSSEKSLALIEQATTPNQRVRVFELNKYTDTSSISFISPALLIVGKTVVLHERFKWKENYEGAGYYFQPLTSALTTADADEMVNQLNN
jgi:uroporphyrin-III C-methyltransferase/precorrin-2 dehydrogenase/sirohydrochlorin ferrochelatase/uroporphyrin-III C-methyltransferase